MRILIVFPRIDIEIRNYWRNDYCFIGNDEVLVELAEGNDIDNRFNNIKNYLLVKNTELLSCEYFGVIIHSTNRNLKSRVKDLINTSGLIKSKLAFVELYSSGSDELTEMNRENYSLGEDTSNLPLDKLRNGIVNQDRLLFIEGFEKVWSYFSGDPFLEARYQVLQICLTSESIKENKSKLDELNAAIGLDCNEIKIKIIWEEQSLEDSRKYNLISLYDAIDALECTEDCFSPKYIAILTEIRKILLGD